MIIIGIGEYGVSADPRETIKTFGLGSCVAVAVFHRPSSVAGLVHVALWNSRANGQKARELPGYFADTGIAALLRQVGEEAGRIHARELEVKIAGGASVFDPNDVFMIGYRNVLAVKHVLARFGLAPAASETGGELSRTVEVHVGKGTMTISSPGRENRII
ncbi:MAG: chemotaxis protein CheD [Thermodesulfobacteriota bacterium]